MKPEDRVPNSANSDSGDTRLTLEEQARVDALLATARRLHGVAFVVSGLSCALSAADLTAQFELPLGDLRIPSTTAAILTYLLTVCLVAVSDRLFRMASPWLPLDPRRPPFAWFILCSGGASFRATSIVILLPVIPAALGSGLTLGHDLPGWVLIWMGVFLAWFLRDIEFSSRLLLSRQDERGGPATLSIWLLYWYRFGRSVIINLFFLSSLLAAVPTWRRPMSKVAGFTIGAMVVLALVRAVGMHAYGRIDAIGGRFGFPQTSPHYPAKGRSA